MDESIVDICKGNPTYKGHKRIKVPLSLWEHVRLEIKNVKKENTQLKLEIANLRELCDEILKLGQQSMRDKNAEPSRTGE